MRFSGLAHHARRRAADERDGVDYHFVDRAALRAPARRGPAARVGRGARQPLRDRAWPSSSGRASEGVDLLLDLDVQGAAQVRQRLPEAVTVFILPPSYPALEQRLRGRGQDDEATIERRLAAAGRELGAFWHYDYAIVNDELDACVRELEEHHPCGALPRPRGRGAGARDREDLRDERGDEDGMTQVILPKDVDSKFRFITVAAQRAKQLQAGAKPRVETRSRKPTRIAVEETLAEAVSWEVLDKLPGGSAGRRPAVSAACRSSSSASRAASGPTRPARCCASCSGAVWTCTW